MAGKVNSLTSAETHCPWFPVEVMGQGGWHLLGSEECGWDPGSSHTQSLTALCWPASRNTRPSGRWPHFPESHSSTGNGGKNLLEIRLWSVSVSLLSYTYTHFKSTVQSAFTVFGIPWLYICFKTWFSCFIIKKKKRLRIYHLFKNDFSQNPRIWQFECKLDDLTKHWFAYHFMFSKIINSLYVWKDVFPNILKPWFPMWQTRDSIMWLQYFWKSNCFYF